MLIAKIENGSVVQIADYRDFGNFCSPPLQEQLDERGFLRVTLYKEHDSRTQKLVSCDPVIDGEFVRTVEVVDKTDEDIQADKASVMAQIRSQRTQLLASCDWTQLSDSPVDKTEWAKYRQALRDLPESIVDPRNKVVWPVRPDSV